MKITRPSVRGASRSTMSVRYHPKKYWERRLNQHFDLRGVGRTGFSESYNVWLYRRKKRCIASFFGRTNLTGKTVLDVGCGTGFFVDWFLKQGALVSGIDITEISVQKLRLQYGCEFLCQDISAQDYLPKQLFDIVNMWDVIYHVVEPRAFGRVITNISHSLKDGGLLLLTDWLGYGSDVRLANHVQARCLETYARTLPSMGFELAAVMPVYTALNTPYLRPLTERLGILLYSFDNLCRKMSRYNLSLAVWHYKRQARQ